MWICFPFFRGWRGWGRGKFSMFQSYFSRFYSFCLLADAPPITTPFHPSPSSSFLLFPLPPGHPVTRPPGGPTPPARLFFSKGEEAEEEGSPRFLQFGDTHSLWSPQVGRPPMLEHRPCHISVIIFNSCNSIETLPAAPGHSPH